MTWILKARRNGEINYLKKKQVKFDTKVGKRRIQATYLGPFMTQNVDLSCLDRQETQPINQNKKAHRKRVKTTLHSL